MMRICAPPDFHQRVLWPEVSYLTSVLIARFNAITMRVQEEVIDIAPLPKRNAPRVPPRPQTEAYAAASFRRGGQGAGHEDDGEDSPRMTSTTRSARRLTLSLASRNTVRTTERTPVRDRLVADARRARCRSPPTPSVARSVGGSAAGTLMKQLVVFTAYAAAAVAYLTVGWIPGVVLVALAFVGTIREFVCATRAPASPTAPIE